MANKKTCNYIFGSETELALRTESLGSNRPVPADLAAAIVDDLADRHVHLPSPQPPPYRRVFLANGGCIYTDLGWHPEIATGECSSPIDLAAQALALRQMVTESAATVGRVHGIPIRVVANNVDYGLGNTRTYGHHLNLLVTGGSLEHVVRQLAPLLAVMPVIAGAGKVSFANLASGFELSQRAAYMAFLLGKQTTQGSRAMVTKKDEQLTDSGFRLHLISLDTTISPWQLILVPAILGLALKAIEAGVEMARGVSLLDPVRALQTVSCDPSLKAKLPLAGGGTVTALDVLDAYREAIQDRVGRTTNPDWADPVLAAWSEMMANLRSDPFREHQRLDWIRKLLLFTDSLRREQLSWADFARWGYVLASVRRLKATFPELDAVRLTSSATARAGIRRSALGVLEHHMARHQLSWRDFPRIWRAANRLCSVCVDYHTLGTDTFRDSCPLLTRKMIHRAITDPPLETRAAIRGEAIRQAPEGATAWWTHLSVGSRRLLMPDAFGANASWQDELDTSTKEPNDEYRDPAGNR